MTFKLSKFRFKDSFATRSGSNVYPQVSQTGGKIDAIVPKKSSYETLTEGTIDNSLEAKTEEYYRQLFADIDEVIAIRNKNFAIEGESYVDFYNPRNKVRTKIYAKDNPNIVEVNHLVKTHIDDDTVRPDVKIWDLGKEGGLLKATVITKDSERHINPIHATNSKIEEWISDRNGGHFERGIHTISTNKKLVNFIKHYYNSAISYGSAFYRDIIPHKGTAARDVWEQTSRRSYSNRGFDWAPQPKEADSNALHLKTQEYYNKFFEEIDTKLESQDNLVDNCVEFWNPRNYNKTKIYSLTSPKVVAVETPMIKNPRVHGDTVTVYDLGENQGGILKAEKIKGSAYLPTLGENSILKSFDKKSGWQESSESLSSVDKVRNFINLYYAGRVR